MSQKLAPFSANLEVRDRKLVRELTQGVIRHFMLLDWYIKKLSRIPIEELDPEVLNTLRLGLYQLIFLSIPEHAAVSESVNLVAQAGKISAKSFVNAALRTFLREGMKSQPPQYLEDQVSFPIDLITNFRKVNDWCGGQSTDVKSLLEALNERPKVCIRVNRLKTTREELFERFRKADGKVKTTPTLLSPDGIILERSKNLKLFPGFKEGHFMVQSEASQMVTRLLLPAVITAPENLRILDACAPPGGKTAHLAELTGDRARITALSPQVGSSGHVKLLENIKRLGLQSINVVNETMESYAHKHPAPVFDYILVDAPCTGLGTIGKHPQRKWFFENKFAAKLAAEQQSILENALALLKPGGTLVYSICSLTLPEWEVGFKVGKILPKLEDVALAPYFISKRNAYVFWPQHLGSEGLFAVRLTK